MTSGLKYRKFYNKTKWVGREYLSDYEGRMTRKENERQTDNR